MPKVIENLEERILEAAERLFSEFGYNDVDVRAISSKTGIAVGTLYNYFPDKKTLFIEVFKKSWEKTFARLEDIIKSNDTSNKKLELFVNEVYEGIVQRKGIGIQLLIDSLHSISTSTTEDSNSRQSNGLEDIGKTLQEKARILIGQILDAYSIQLDRYILSKLADAIILLIWGSVSDQFEDKAKSIKFICDMILRYILEQVADQKQ